ncbi:MAG: YbaK/EbsC family protein [Chlamydiales bacterium]|nr:YbaK/EbsC family protein [Chlamydiales bacterium]
MSLSKSAESVQKILLAKNLQAKVIELPASTRTAEDAAKAIGCMIGQIVKSLVFRTKSTNKPILVLASGPNRVNEQTISHHVGEEIVKADAEFTREVTGFAIGGVPPIGHKQSISTYMDEDLLQFQELWAAAGTPHAVFNLNPETLVSLTAGKVISIK